MEKHLWKSLNSLGIAINQMRFDSVGLFWVRASNIALAQNMHILKRKKSVFPLLVISSPTSKFPALNLKHFLTFLLAICSEWHLFTGNKVWGFRPTYVLKATCRILSVHTCDWRNGKIFFSEDSQKHAQCFVGCAGQLHHPFQCLLIFFVPFPIPVQSRELKVLRHTDKTETGRWPYP